MAKYTGKAQTLTALDVALTCINSVEYSESPDTYQVACAAATAKAHVVGQNSITATVSVTLESNATTQITTYNPGNDSTGDATPWDHGFSATTGDTRVTSTKATVLDRSISVPVEGLVTMSLTFGLDDITFTTVA